MDVNDTGTDTSADFDWGFEDSSESQVSETPVETGEIPGERVQAETQVPQESQVPQQIPQQQVQQQPEPQQPQFSQEQLQQQYEQRRAEQAQQYETQLQAYYAFDEESAIALATEPAKVLPVLAARLHRTIFDQVVQFVSSTMQQQLPLLINQTQQQNTVAQTQTDTFFKMWPELAGQEALVVELGKQYRKANPTTSFEDFTKQVGSMVWLTLGKPIDQMQQRLMGAGQPQQRRIVDRVPANNSVPGAGAPIQGDWISGLLEE